MKDKMPDVIYVYETKLDRKITYWPHHGNRKTVKYHRAIVSKEEARDALAHFANVGWNEHCSLADKQDKEFMDKTIIKSLEQAAK